MADLFRSFRSYFVQEGRISYYMSDQKGARRRGVKGAAATPDSVPILDDGGKGITDKPHAGKVYQRPTGITPASGTVVGYERI